MAQITSEPAGFPRRGCCIGHGMFARLRVPRPGRPARADRPPGDSSTVARLDFDPIRRNALHPAPAASALLLLVDDDQHGREGWAEFFREAGYRVSQASDGQEALAKLADRLPDLVLVDLGIPRLDGWELTRHIKGDPGSRDVPVIVLSGLDYPDSLERVTAAGCDAFVSKPCEPLRLLAIVRGLLARRQARR
jgi:CheY-like chemotaxis protein